MKNKRIFKILTLTLVISILATSFCLLASCNNSEEETPTERTQEEKETIFSIGVLADPQVLAASAIDDPTIANKAFYKYCKLDKCPTKLLDFSEAIFKTAVDNLIAEKVDVVFFIGDLAETGGYTSEQIVVEGCQKLKSAGIQVFVASGLCDTSSQSYTYTGPLYWDDDAKEVNEPIDAAKFKTMFADFGYNQALFQDTNSISYMADITGTNYRVLMLENTNGYEGSTVKLKDDTKVNPMTDEQMAWIESALQDAQRCGKEVFVISSLPIQEDPISFYTVFMSDTYVTMDRGEDLQNMFLKYGVNYVFSGHMHIGAQNQKTDDLGNTLYEITTTSLAIYPSAYNIVEIKDDFTYLCKEKRLATLNESYLPSYIDTDDKQAVLSDFNAYVKDRFKEDFAIQRTYDADHKHGNIVADEDGHEMILDFLVSLGMYPAYVKDEQGKDTDVIDEETSALYEQISHDVRRWMADINNLKLYGTGEDSIEGILKPYGLTMPDSEFKNFTVLDYVMDIIYRMMEGTFDANANGVDVDLFANIFYAGAKKFADIDILNRLHALDSDVKACNISEVMDKFITTDIIDLKLNNFLLCVISLFYPYLRDSQPLLFVAVKNLNDTDALLNSMDLLMPVVTAGIEELYLFANEEGKLETDFVSLSKGEIYGNALISQIFFPVLTRTAVIL